MFITFTHEYNDFVDNIKNGFLLQNHKVNFSPSPYHLLHDLIPFWEEYGINDQSIITYTRLLYKKHNKKITNAFFDDFIIKIKSDFAMRASWSLLTGTFNSASIPMKCFTEIRDNQKIHPSHTVDFGELAILMKEDWMKENEGCPVIYSGINLMTTSLIARNLSMLQTLDKIVKESLNLKNVNTFKSFFDLISYFETEEHSHEYEWRIVGSHKLAGAQANPKPDRVEFSFDDIHSFYVPNDNFKIKLLNFLNDLKTQRNDNHSVPQLYKTEEIVLTKKEMAEIKKIQTRR